MINVHETSIIDIIETIVDKTESSLGKEITTEYDVVDFTGTKFYRVRFTTDGRFYSEPFFIDYENPYSDLAILSVHLKYLFLK